MPYFQAALVIFLSFWGLVEVEGDVGVFFEELSLGAFIISVVVVVVLFDLNLTSVNGIVLKVGVGGHTSLLTLYSHGRLLP